MKLKEYYPIVEALLFVAGDEGVSLTQISTVLNIEKDVTKELLDEMKKQYDQDHKGIQIVEYAETYQFVTKKSMHSYLQKLVESPVNQNLSQASLETLAIIAYKQPITRVEIEELRGVKTDKALQTLLSKYLIKEVGRLESSGRPILYGTTKEFLDYFAMKNLEDLPSLKQDEEDIMEETDLFFDRLHKNSDS